MVTDNKQTLTVIRNVGKYLRLDMA